jgi:hypothetical protein
MSFAESDTTIQEQGVIRFGRSFCHRERGSVSKLVGGADNEGVKPILWVKSVVNGFEIEPTLRGRILVNNRDSFRYVDDADIPHSGQARSFDHDVDVVIEPILKITIGNADKNSFAIMLEKLCRLEPCGVALWVDFLFDYL